MAEADALVASTPVEAEELVELYGADPRRVHVVEPGVDLDRFVPGDRRSRAARRSGCRPTARSSLFAGRVQALKAPDVLVSALGVLRRPDGRSRCSSCSAARRAGRAPSRSSRRSRTMTGVAGRRASCTRRRTGTPSRLVPRGRRRRDAVAQRVVRAGRRRRRRPAACPVIAACVGGLRTIVDHDVSGRLVRGHDPEVWADVIADVLASSEDRARYAVGARGRWPSGSAGRPRPTRCSRCTRWRARSGRSRV